MPIPIPTKRRPPVELVVADELTAAPSSAASSPAETIQRSASIVDADNTTTATETETARSLEETIEETTKRTTEEASKNSAEQTTESSTEQTAEQTAEEPAEEPGENAVAQFSAGSQHSHPLLAFPTPTSTPISLRLRAVSVPAPQLEPAHTTRESSVDSVSTNPAAALTLQYPNRPHRGRRERSLSPIDSETREIDVDNIKMAELCRDIHIGRTTPNFEKLKKLKQDERTRKRTEQAQTAEERQERIKKQEEEDEDRRKKAVDIVEKGVGGKPLLKLLEGGKIDIDQDTLQVDRHAIANAGRSSGEAVEESDLMRVVNSASWSRRERVERWSTLETNRFYEALSMWGTDFGLIAQMFGGRSRRQIKNKFNAEERKNPGRVHIALNHRIPVGMDYLEKNKVETNKVETVE